MKTVILISTPMTKLTQKQKAIIFDAERTVEKFNKNFPIGSKVMHKKIGIKSFPFEERIVKGKAFVSNSYEPVAYFEGLSGYYSITSDFIDYSQADAKRSEATRCQPMRLR